LFAPTISHAPLASVVNIVARRAIVKRLTYNRVARDYRRAIVQSFARDVPGKRRSRSAAREASMSLQEEQPKPRGRIWPYFAAAGAGAALIAVVMIAGLFVADRYDVQTLTLKPTSQVAAAGSPVKPPLQTEAYFINGLKSQPATADEWWSARSDHKLLAYALLNCKHLTSLALDALPRQHFSALMLDLDPNGNHVFLARDGDEAMLYSRDKEVTPLSLTGADQQYLSLSDSIARARLAAADGANSNVPWVMRLGLITVIVSGLATLFVTLQGKTRAVELSDEEKQTLDSATARVRFAHAVAGPGSGFRWVAFMAILLSITGTALNGLKQVYDPTRTLTQNTRALLELRQLHQDVILNVGCVPNGAGPGATMAGAAQKQKMTEWTGAIRRIRATILPEYGAYAALDVGGASQRIDAGSPPAPPEPPATIEARQADKPPAATSGTVAAPMAPASATAANQ
jgi:hypothetical protein